jgi:hypothetical protein
MEKLREHTTIFYSTHILDDVHRVSGTAIILNPILISLPTELSGAISSNVDRDE